MALLVDYHVHALGHGEGRLSLAHLEDFVAKARQNGLEELGLAEHDEFVGLLDPVFFARVREEFAPLTLRLGLEVSWRPEREEEIRAMAARLPFDYLIGSVHDLAGWPFDHPDFVDGYAAWDVDELYRRYFGAVARAAASRLFDVIGHLDLIKVFGYRSRRPVLELAGEALAAIKEAGVAVEVNTAGLFKPAGEIYPARELLEACFARGIPITFGSDAHRAEEVGRELARAVELAHRVGYRCYVRFCRRQAKPVPF